MRSANEAFPIEAALEIWAPSAEAIRPAMQVNVIDPRSDPEWDRIIASQPDANAFQTAAWARVLSATYGHRPFYLQCAQANGEVATLPMMEVDSRLTGRRGVSLPFSDFCRPSTDDREISGAFFEKLCSLARERRWKYFELRGASGLTSGATPAKTFRSHELDLHIGAEQLFDQFESAIRRGIRKAEKSGLKVRISRGRGAIDKFYALHSRTRRRHGTPPQPRRFFENIWRHLIDAGLGFVVLAELNERCLAAAVFFQNGHSGLYKFGASDERFQEHRGNNMVMWEGIRNLAENGATHLHFGRTSNENEGLSRYKRSWGARESTLEYFRYDPAAAAWLPPATSGAGRSEKMFRNLPLAVNRLIGALCYPHLD
ncbi:MAG: GNAT family N-acetyltransferase [Verrucomicrobiota bacterium]|nr:GNAT family N-acetyltransferase [Verrucomicrobiota bacterium]